MIQPSEYFASLQEEMDFLGALRKKVKAYFSELSSCAILQAQMRSHKLYHGLSFEDGSEDAIKIGGDDGELALLNINEYRSVLSLLRTYVTGNKIEWDPLASKNDFSCLEATRLAREVLDDMLTNVDYCLQEHLNRAVEHSIVYADGYLCTYWNEYRGNEVDADPMTGEIYHSGDVCFHNPLFTDVAYDHTADSFEESQWVQVRERMNKYDLVALYPEAEEDILAAKRTRMDQESVDFTRNTREDKDVIYAYKFWHKRTPAVPDGRYVYHINSKILLDRPLDDKETCCVRRLSAGRWLMSPFGWTPAFSLAGPQEALDAAVSAIVTICNTGGPKYWIEPNASIGEADLEGFGTVIQSATKPEKIDSLTLPPDLPNSAKMHLETLQRLSGVNATARGTPQASVKAAKALAFVEQRTSQSASELVDNYTRFCEQVGTDILRIIQLRSTYGRNVSTSTGAGQTFMREYTADALDGLDKVAVVRGNPDLNTLAGRIQVGQSMLEAGLIKDPNNFLQLMKTGNLKDFTAADDGQARAVKSENERILRGEMPSDPLDIDNHVMHIMKHASECLDTPAMRESPKVAPIALAHMAAHMEKLSDPLVVQYMSMFYPSQQIPPGLLPQPAPMPGTMPQQPGAPPEKEQEPKPPEQVPPQPPKLEQASQRANTAEKQSASQGPGGGL